MTIPLHYGIVPVLNGYLVSRVAGNGNHEFLTQMSGRFSWRPFGSEMLQSPTVEQAAYRLIEALRQEKTKAA